MNGALLRTTSAFAIAAAAGLLATFATSAEAADLGGSCCADLEERVAELEATTARKGNRKVSLTVYGQVNETLLFWDDGEESNAYVVTNENSRSRFGFRGVASINPEWSAGYRLEIGVRIANSAGVSQFVDDDTSSTASLDLRYSTWWIESKRLGGLWVGHGDMATEGITEIDLSNAQVIGNNEINTWNGGFFLRREIGAVSGLSGLRWQDISSQANGNVGEGDRRNVIRYMTPTLHGFTFSASWGEDDVADAALRYAAEFNGVRVAAGVGFQHWTDGNGFFGSNGDRGCANLHFTGGRNDGDVDCDTVGMSGSILHVPTGLFIHAAYGKLEDENRDTLVANTTRERSRTFGNDSNGEAITTTVLSTFNPADFEDEDQHWYLQAGIERNFFGIGKSTFFGEFFKGETGAGLTGGALRILPTAPTPDVFSVGIDTAIAESEVDVWGIGYVQSIDAAAMDLYIGFRNYSGEVTAVSADKTTIVTKKVTENGVEKDVEVTPRAAVVRGVRKTLDVEDFQAVMAGGMIRF